MQFPEWAPEDLINYYKGFPELNNEYLIRDHQMIFRLLTRPEMEQVWAWVAKQDSIMPITSNGGIVGRFLNKLDEYGKTARVPASERANDFDEIFQLANKLSIKLQKYQNESHAFNQYTALISPTYDEQLIAT